jgi:glycosyltransferase involved in cell wall biosynthesis
MNVWIIQTGEMLPLSPGVRWMRSGLLSAELARRGHQVTWWASAFEHHSKSWITPADSTATLQCGVTIRLLAGCGYRKNISVRRFLDHAKVARKFARAASSAPLPDLIVAALPDYRIAYQAFLIAQRHGIPFVLDLRDRWPWDFLPLLPTIVRSAATIILKNDFRMATEMIIKADCLTSMMESWLGWARSIGRPSISSDRTYYLGAERPSAQELAPDSPVRAVLRECEGRWVILFIGQFTSRSAPMVLLEAAKKIRDSSPEIFRSLRFVLAGAGDYMPLVRGMAAGIDNVILTGFVSDPEIGALVRVARGGVVPANSDFEGVPNKVFTYLSGGVPLISAVKGELAQLIGERGLGLSFSDADSLAEAILKLYHDPALQGHLSQRAAAVFSQSFDSNVIYQEFADHLERLLDRTANSRHLQSHA